LCSRKVREEGGLRPNLYMLALAGSGTGKAYPRKVNSHVLTQIGLGAAIGNQIASGQGLEDEMLVQRKMLYQTDEIDQLMRCLASSKESYYGMLLSILLQLYSEADEIHVVRTKVRDRGREPRGEVDQPGLIIFGTATPECFFDSLSPTLLTNGLFSRAIVVDANQRGRKQRSKDVSEMPAHLIETAAWWRDYHPSQVNPSTGRQPNLEEEHPTPAIVPQTNDGLEILDQFADEADDEYHAATEASDRVRAVLWTRAGENALRLSLVYACSRDHQAPCIDSEVATWAVRFAGHLVRRMVFLASHHVAENPFHEECLRLVRKLHEAPSRELSHQVLLKRMKMRSKDFRELISTLLERGDIMEAKQATGGRTRSVYRLNEGVK